MGSTKGLLCCVKMDSGCVHHGVKCSMKRGSSS